MAYGETFISRVLDTGDVQAFYRFGLTSEFFPTKAEQSAREFILKYSEQHNGRVPDYRTVEGEIEGFTYIPEATDSLQFLADGIKEHAARVRVSDFLVSKELAEDFESKSMDEFIAATTAVLEGIRRDTNKGVSVGIDLKRDIDRYLKEFEERKAGKSVSMWRSKFSRINHAIGAYYGGNVYAWFGRTGRGKTAIVLHEAIEAARQGATVLIWSMELPFYELVSRIIAGISSYESLLEVLTEDGTVDAGFNYRALVSGQMAPEMEELLYKFLQKLNSTLKGNIVVRTVDDETFTDRSVSRLDAEIKQVEADVVVIDPIYYLDMEKNTSKTAGGDVAKTSQALRRIAGKNKVVVHVLTQAEEIKDDTDEDGHRRLVLPKRAEVKKAKQIMEDAAAQIALDSMDGRALLGVVKGRDGGEDIVTELQFMPEIGVIRELAGQLEQNGGDLPFQF
jgi:replicative DNA helicase